MKKMHNSFRSPRPEVWDDRTSGSADAPPPSPGAVATHKEIDVRFTGAGDTSCRYRYGPTGNGCPP
jgi:hypothetical protein